MTSSYPAEIDTWAPLQDNIDYPMADYLNTLHANIIAVETTLGLSPQGPFDTVAARLQALTPQ